MRNALFALAMIVAVASSTLPLLADPLPESTTVRVDVANTTKTCAWVSLYLRRNQTPWQMETSSDSRPHTITAGSRRTFYVRFPNSLNVPLPAEIKALVAFYNTKDCTGPAISNFGEAQVFTGKILENVDMSATLSGQPFKVHVARTTP